MKRLVAIPVSIACTLLFGGLVITAGCKQGVGERCQINDDCEADLVCNQATEECVRMDIDNEPNDVLPPIDAPPIDAVDAPPDAPDAS